MIAHASALAQMRGLVQLLAEGATGITHTVESMHGTVQRLSPPLGPSKPVRARGLAGVVYASVRGGIRAGGWLCEEVLARLDRGDLPGLSGEASTGTRLNLLSMLNGVYGDHLHARRNPLAIPMQFLHAGDAWRPGIDALPPSCAELARPRIVLCVHGLCLNETHWDQQGKDHGVALAEDLDATLLHLRYNTGRSISENGRELSARLEALVRAWPHRSLNLHVLAHSMGGLVTRAAWHAASNKHRWPRQLRSAVFLGTPHHGAPLERLGHGLERALGLSPYAAPIVRLGTSRSQGIVDLRHGRCTGRGADPGSMSRSVPLYAVAGRLGGPGSDSRPGLPARLLGDGLVPERSALGRHASRDLGIPDAQCWTVDDCGHMQLLGDDRVQAQLRRWMKPFA